MVTFIEVIGWIATVITICMYMPQTIKTFRTKNVDGLSKTTYCMIAFGSVMWMFFGTAIHSWQAWTANAVVLLMLFVVFYFLFRQDLVFVIIGIAVVVASMIATVTMLALNVGSNSIMATVTAIIGGCGTGLPFIPQVIKIYRTKIVTSISIISTFSVVAANFMWFGYYLFKIIHYGFEPGNLVAMLFSLIGMLTAALVAFAFFKFRAKSVPQA